MTDIAAQLRRLYEAAPQGKWRSEPDRRVGYRIYSADEIERNHTTAEEPETADLIVAMHNHLPQLLDVVDEARNVRLYHSDPGMLKAMLYRLGEALAALERSDDQ